MSNQSPYEQLGVSEDSSFEEIKTARDRMMAQCEGDRKQIEGIEAAYDAVLMDRLRLRQEGKIKVPDRIRFPEKAAPPPAPAPAQTRTAPAWLQRLIDTPSPTDIWVPAAIFSGLSVLVYYTPIALQPALVGGVGAAFYFLYRKEQKLGRTVLLGLLGLVSGFIAGGTLWTFLQPQLMSLGLSLNTLDAIVAFVLLWLISSFLK